VARDKALRLREYHEVFLQDRRATEASIVQLAQALEARRCSVATLSQHQKACQDSLATAATTTPPAAAVAAAAASANERCRSVSFADDEAGQEVVYRISSDGWPLHGHLASPEGFESEMSLQQSSHGRRKLAGRKITLQTRSTSFDCILVEPVKKMLESDNFVTSGLVVCLHGPDSLDSGNDLALEWAQVLRHTKLLDAGFSVLLHDVPLNMVADVEALIEAALAQLDMRRCVLIGKGLGAPLAASMAEADSRLVETCSLAGVLFIMPPEGDVPEACSRLHVPSLILGARGSMCTRDWINIVNEEGTMPVACRMANVSSSDLAKILRKDKEAAAAICHFIIAVLLMAEFSNADDPAWNNSSELPKHVVRLCDELPEYLVPHLDSTHASRCHDPGLAAAATVRCRHVGILSVVTELYEILQSWVRRGLVQQAMATE